MQRLLEKTVNDDDNEKEIERIS